MKLIWLIVPILIATSCPRHQKIETDSVVANETSEKESIEFRQLIQPTADKKKVLAKDEKELLSDVLFSAAMIESEILKLIRPEYEQKTNPFQVVSAAFDIASGRPAKFKLSECKLWKTQKLNENRVDYIQNCVAPGADFFSIEKKSNESWKVILKSSQWGAYLGAAVALTAVDRECFLQAKEGRIKVFECQNTVLGHQPQSGVAAIYELRLSQFQIRVDSQNQVEIAGGFFKDLVEYRKINLLVPKDGKIKITEKALKVRDDFAHLLKDQNPKEINPAENVVKTLEPNTESSDNSVKESQGKNEDKKENFQEGHQENNQESNHPQNSFETNHSQESGQENLEEGSEKNQSPNNNQEPKNEQPIRRGR